MAIQGWAGKAPKRPLMRFTEARNDKPPFGGLTRLSGGLTLELRFQRDGSLTDSSSPVNHPTTPNYSGTLVGETTHRATLNLDRGSQPLGARRIVGKRKWQPEQSGEKLPTAGWLRQSSKPLHDTGKAFLRLNRAEFTISHQGFMTKLYGSVNGMSKLNPTIVKRIRKAARLRRELSNKGLARKYKISVAAVRNVLKGARWGWVQ